MSLLLLLALACDPAPPPPVAAPEAPDGLSRVLALARGCAGSAPLFGEGRGGSPLVLGHGMVLWPEAGGAWRVHFGEEAPASAPYGRVVVVDPATGTCDGQVVPVPAGGPGPSLAVLRQAGWRCARSLGSDGVGGSALVEEGVSLSLLESGAIIAHVEEMAPASIPNGRDLSLGTDGSACRAVAMD